MMCEPYTVMGFDYGHKRIGVAIGQTLTGTAQPLTTIHVQTQGSEWESLNTLIQEWRPQGLVVGFPQQADGSDSKVIKAIRRFCQQLQQRYQLPIYTVDETLSSVVAAERICSRLRKKSRASTNATKREQNLDAIAAQVILETWLAAFLLI